MNNNLLNKLLLAVKQKGKEIKLESKMLYSEDKHKFITVYILYGKQPSINRQGESVMKWQDIYTCFNKRKLIIYLADMFKGSEVNGKTNGKAEEIY